jgi:glycosyltransferase involved in cell wall biosynthesis
VATHRAPFITVVICTRNRGPAVVQTVRTVLRNDYPHYEIIVVDQSDDGRTQDALRPFLDTSQVTYCSMSTRGLAAGRNFGIHAAPKSEYIAMTDDDCEVPPNWLSAMVEAFEADSRIGLVFGNVVPVPHDRKAGFVPAYERREPFLARDIRDKHEVEGIGGCMGVRRSVWYALGGFDEMLGLGAPFPAGEEGDFAIRTLLAGNAIYETPAIQLVHRGFYTWQAGKSVVYRNWFGTGAMLSKHIRCRHWSVMSLLFRIAWRWAFARSRSAASLGMRSYKWLRLQAFLEGMLAGLRAPLNKETGQFERTPTIS